MQTDEAAGSFQWFIDKKGLQAGTGRHAGKQAGPGPGPGPGGRGSKPKTEGKKATHSLDKLIREQWKWSGVRSEWLMREWHAGEEVGGKAR